MAAVDVAARFAAVQGKLSQTQRDDLSTRWLIPDTALSLARRRKERHSRDTPYYLESLFRETGFDEFLVDPGFGPDEWLGVLVVRFDERIDMLTELRDGSERSTGALQPGLTIWATTRRAWKR